MAKMSSISMKLVSGVGFSNGCALLALKKPPPLVPSSLMASCEATGPSAMVCLPPSSVVTSRYGREVLDHALRDQQQREDDRDRQEHVEIAANEIDPEVAERLGAVGPVSAGEPARERQRDADARAGRGEVVPGEPRHLGEVAHRRLARRTPASWCWW